MQLSEAFRFTDDEITAFVGAGGKTTAMFIAARELVTRMKREDLQRTVFVTTTTHLGSWQKNFADDSIQVNSSDDLLSLEEKLPEGVVLLFGRVEKNRLGGLSENYLDQLVNIAKQNQLPLLLEADGANGRPLKSPSLKEPVIPDFVRKVVQVAGLAGLGKPLTNEWVHRPEIFSDLAGINVGDVITSEAVTKILLNPIGGLKNIPETARKIILLNQADSENLQSAGRSIAGKVIPPYHAVIIASLNKDHLQSPHGWISPDPQNVRIYSIVEQTGGIILAAGSSSRLGKPKQLLDWKGEPFIRRITQTAIDSGLFPVIVVVGSNADEVASAISDLPVNIIRNSNWKEGVSSSIRAGIDSMPDFVGGAMFLQADQPQSSQPLIRKIIEAHQVTLDPIIAPQIDGQRGNPVLFDRQTFHLLHSLEGEMGGRALFQQYPIHWVPWHDHYQLLDVDTLEDYRIFLEIYG